MRLTEISLKNPAGVGVVTAIILLIGVVAIFSLPTQLLPDIERPEITIATSWRAAAPSEVESEIVDLVEDVMQGIPGLEEMESRAFLGFAFTNLEFSLDSDMNQIMLEVISRMNRLPPLPADADPPQIIMGGFGSSAQKAIVSLFARLDPESGYTKEEQAQYLKDVAIPRLRAIPGVANIDSFGALDQNQELQIIFDPLRAADLGIDITNIPGRVGRINDVSGGVIDVGKRQFTLRFKGKYEPEDLSKMIIEWRNGVPIRLGDFATVSLESPRPTGFANQNGREAIYMRVVKANGANVMAVLNEVEEAVAELNKNLLEPHGINLNRSFNPAVYIQRAINLLTGNLFFGMLLAIGALWWFLRKLRATLIIAITIPVSLLSTLVVLLFAGRSINVISLAGLAFASGMVLDAAIVVLENIVRLREQGMEKTEASIQGAGQVWAALFASTLTTVAIFFPVLFMNNAEGQLFADLALTIAISVTFSLFIAVTILPMAAGKLLKSNKLVDIHDERWRKMAKNIIMLTGGPKRRLGWILGLMVVPITLTVFLMPNLNYLPPLKSDVVYGNYFAPPSTSFGAMQTEVNDVILERLKPYLDGDKEPQLLNYGVFSFGGGQNGVVFIRSKDPARTEELPALLQNEILAGFPDVFTFTRQGNLFGDFGDDGNVAIHLQGRDIAAMADAAFLGRQLISDRLPGVFVQMDPDVSVVSPVLQVVPDDERILEAGWTRNQVSTLVRALGDGVWLGEYFDGNNRLDIILKSKPVESPEILAGTPVVTPSGQVVTLGSLASVNREVGPQVVKRIDGRRTLSLSFAPPDGMALDEVVAILEDEIEPQIKAALPPGAGITYGGSADSLKQAVKSLGLNFILAIGLLFMIMAALFKSLRDSLLVVISIPLATVGGVGAIRLLNLFTFQPMDLLTMIGFIILLGLVVNNAILLVVQTRRSEAEGLTRKEAVEEALRIRIRPILMSTITSLLGMLPLLLFPGEGSVVYRGMAAAIVGGMSVSTIFTLILLPTLLQLKGHLLFWRKSPVAERAEYGKPAAE